MAKRKRACKKEIDLAGAEKEIGEAIERVQGKDEANEGDENETDEQNPAKPVQETGEIQERKATQDTQLPGYHSNTDFKPLSTVLEPHPKPSCGLHSHTNVTTKKTTFTVSFTSSDESTMV
ncbi:hypothetical protein OS493_027075 [Desmophyllum pertusum]|uniref:Uncharacterized protein n=1 Tax=Desmophyllum pertusum TaxID=174260 RepID=A0A9X0CD46_9CNID|nr:hypothetical protein OS493_027075 [Desmophyllum pertusum]